MSTSPETDRGSWEMAQPCGLRNNKKYITNRELGQHGYRHVELKLRTMARSMCQTLLASTLAYQQELRPLRPHKTTICDELAYWTSKWKPFMIINNLDWEKTSDLNFPNQNW